MIELLHEIKDYFDWTKDEPRNIALGAALAAFLGFVPLKCGLVAVIVFLIGMTSANGTASALLAAILKPLSIFVLDGTSVSIGRSICESDWARVHTGIFNGRGFAFLGLERYHVMGGAILGLAAAIPFFIIFYRLQQVVVKIRAKMVDKAKELKKKRAEEKALKAGATPAEAQAAAEAAIAPKPEKAPGFLGKVIGAFRTFNAIPLKKWILLAILLAVFELFLAKPTMRSILKAQMPDGLARAMGMVDPTTGQITQRGKVDFDDVSFNFSLVGGQLHIQDLQVTNPKNPKENLFSAKTIDCKVDMSALMRKQFLVENVTLENPKLAVAREQDGSLGIEPQAAPGSAAAAQPAQASGNDWASKGKDYLDRAKKKYEERKKQEEEKKKQEGSDAAKAAQKDALAKAQAQESFMDRLSEGLPGENDALHASAWVVRAVNLTGFGVDFQDPQSQAPSFAFKEGHLLELAQNRQENGKATVLDLLGAIVDAGGANPHGQVKLDFSIDPPPADGSPVAWKLHAELSSVDLHQADNLIAGAVPLAFDKGTATLTVDAVGHGIDGDLDSQPKMSFKGVAAKARHPGDKIAGMDASKVAEEVTNCGDFDLNDFHVTGSLISPKVDSGNTLKDLVVQGGLNYGKKKATEAVDKAVDKATQQIEKKLPGIEKKVPGLEKVAPGLEKNTGDGADDVKKKAGDLFNGFGK